MKNNGVSVVICCYNSKLRLPETLKHLAKQEVSEHIEWEVILVDNNSTDNTASIAKEEWLQYDKTIVLKVTDEKKPGLANARKKGVHESKYQYIIFCNDDNWLDSKYIEKVFQRLIENHKIGAIGGQGIPVSSITIPEWLYNYKDSFACGPQAKKSGYVTHNRNYLYGAGLAVRRDLLVDIFKNAPSMLSDRKGSSLSSGGDSEITMQVALLVYELYYDEELKFKHFMPSDRISLAYIAKLHKAFGHAHYHLYPLQLQIQNKLKTKPRFPNKRLFNILKTDLKPIFFYLFKKKHFSENRNVLAHWELLFLNQIFSKREIFKSFNYSFTRNILAIPLVRIFYKKYFKLIDLKLVGSNE